MDPVTAVGLALAIAPLLIAALQEYQSAALKIKQSVLYESTMQKLIRALEFQIICFDDNLENLLKVAVPDGIDIKPSSDLWKSKTTVTKVEEYLGKKKFGHIRQTISEFENCICDIGTEFGRFLGAPKVRARAIAPRTVHHCTIMR